MYVWVPTDINLLCFYWEVLGYFDIWLLMSQLNIGKLEISFFVFSKKKRECFCPENAHAGHDLSSRLKLSADISTCEIFDTTQSK